MNPTMYRNICKPAKRTPDEDYSLLFVTTGRYTMIEQGFGVCDRVADSINTGNYDPTTEIGEIALSITNPPKE